MSPPREQNIPLEGVRGLAALGVALSHTFFSPNLEPGIRLPDWLRTLEMGHAGVLLFFVLSGYLIGWTNGGPCTKETIRTYIKRRLWRLAPIYYFALALTIAVTVVEQQPGQIRPLVFAGLGLQNFNGYFGFHTGMPMMNGPLWSLNFELVYYGIFIVLWRYQPKLIWVFGPAFAITALCWLMPSIVPLFLGGYAAGWLFWAAGWWLSRLPAEPAGERHSILTWVLLIFAGHQIEGARRILNALGLHSADPGMVSLADLGSLPAILLLISAVTRRRLPHAWWFITLAWLPNLISIAGMLWTGKLGSHPAWITGFVAVVLAFVTTGVRSTIWLKYFAWFGGISYAFYLVHFPLLFVVRLWPLPGGGVIPYIGRMVVWAVIAVALSWLLEKHFQPRIRALWSKPVAS